MTQPQLLDFTTPVGRVISGDLYEPKTKDAQGQPMVVKNGPNAGQPRSEIYFALAIPKGTEPHWAHTQWGQVIWNAGHQAFPQGQAQSPTFSWKVVDGDSTIPNSKGNKPCDMEGAKGCWVLHFSSSFTPKIVNVDGSQVITEPGAVKRGYFVQVMGSVGGNGSPLKPGVYLNHRAVALSGYGPEIAGSVDVSKAGFGQGIVLPPGASPTPIGGLPPAGVQAPAAPAAHAAPLPGAMAPVPAAAAPQPVAVAPNHAYVAAVGATPAMVPPAPGAVVAAPVAHAPPQATALPPMPGASMPMPMPGAPARQMTAKANGFSYEQLIAAGWTDDTLRAAGMML